MARELDDPGPGRPPLDDNDTSVKVCVTLPSKVYDDLYRRAQRARLAGVPELIRLSLGTNHDNKNI